jgi:hypothetical protein
LATDQENPEVKFQIRGYPDQLRHIALQMADDLDSNFTIEINVDITKKDVKISLKQHDIKSIS